MTDRKQPEFRPTDAMYAHSILFQALLIQLMESEVLTVEHAERVFDIAIQRARKVRDAFPGVEGLIHHLHDNLKWDDLYQWSADQRANKNRSDDPT